MKVLLIAIVLIFIIQPSSADYIINGSTSPAWDNTRYTNTSQFEKIIIITYNKLMDFTTNSSDDDWTKTGTLIYVDDVNDYVYASGIRTGTSDHQIVHSEISVPDPTSWKINFTYNYTVWSNYGQVAVGVSDTQENYGNGQSDAVTHGLWFTCAGYTGSNQKLYIRYNDGVSSNTSAGTMVVAAGTTLYVTLEKVSDIQGKVSVFSDSARTTHISNSPTTIDLNTNISNAKYMIVSNSNTSAGLDGTVVHVDDLRFISGITQGNITHYYNQGAGYVTGSLIINMTGNINYTVETGDNASGVWVQSGGYYTANSTPSITSKYQNTDVRLVFYGNETHSSEHIQITFVTESSGIVAPSITSYAPSTPNSSWANVDKTFNFTTNQTGNHTYWMDGNLAQTNTSVTDSTYTNLSANNKGLSGLQNLTMKVENINGTDTQKIDWTINVPFITTNITHDDRTNLSYNRIFDIITITPGIEDVSIGYGNTDSGNTYALNHANGTRIGSSQTVSSDNETVWFNNTVSKTPEANGYYISESTDDIETFSGVTFLAIASVFVAVAFGAKRWINRRRKRW